MCLFAYIHISLRIYLETEKKDTKIKVFSQCCDKNDLDSLLFCIFLHIFHNSKFFCNKGKKKPRVIIIFFKFQDTLIDCTLHRSCLRNTAPYLALLN